jgi:CubicO group peptidase (beta-lactamase class C family)
MGERTDDVEAFVRQDVADGIFATAAQVYVSVGEEPVLDFGVGIDGAGAPVDTTSLFSVYCAAKPVLAVAIGCLVDDGELSLDDRLGHVLDPAGLSDTMAATTVADLLNHTAGLHDLRAYVLTAMPPRLHGQIVRDLRPPPTWIVGRSLAYAEAASWYLLGECVEALAGISPRAFVSTRVLEPLGACDDFFVGGMSEAEFEERRTRLAVNNHMGDPATPMLLERIRRFRCLASPAFANTATMRAIGRFYEGLLGELRGAGSVLDRSTLRALVRPASHGVDLTMGRTCGYGHGFMVGLDEHDFGRHCSAAAFGHTGYRGMTVAFCDPRVELVVAYHLNGVADAATTVGFRRPIMVEMIYRALGLAGPPHRSS